MKFENTKVWGFEHAIRGMRNPKESWSRIDSKETVDENGNYAVTIGPNDMKLMQALIAGGPPHRKFMRQIFVSVDITAALLWWKEFDTYKVGTVANSTSTMHKITSKPITVDCFEMDDFNNLTVKYTERGPIRTHDMANKIIEYCEQLRQKYLETKDKQYWKELIRWLPESWLQTRTVTLSYETLCTIVEQRYAHKLNEWSGKDDSSKPNFIGWVKTLPYAKELIFYSVPLLREGPTNNKAFRMIFNYIANSPSLTTYLKEQNITLTDADGQLRSTKDILKDLGAEWRE